MKLKFLRREKGATLVELLIYCSLLASAFYGIYTVFFASMQYYHATRSNIEIQQQLIGVMNQFTRELRESNLTTVCVYPTGSPTIPAGIVFESIRDSSGQITYQTTGVPYWRKFICYYIDTSPTDSTQYAVYRREWAFTGSFGVSPESPNPSLPGNTLAFKQGSLSGISERKIIVDHVLDCDFYYMSSGSKVYSGKPTDNPMGIDLTVSEDSIGRTNTISTSVVVELMN